MSIEYTENQAVFRDVASVEEAQDLLAWLQNKPAATVDLGACTHLHAINLQILMAAQNRIAVWPYEPNLRVWLEFVLKSEMSPFLYPYTLETFPYMKIKNA
jgi:hypothetical protein